MSDVKQVLVIRKDLNMRKGKMIAMGAHASLKALFDWSKIEGQTMTIYLNNDIIDWFETSFKKITVSVSNESELVDVYQRAVNAGLVCSLIQDQGLTEFNGVPTLTAVAVGPALSSEIDPITGHLPLL